MRVETCNPASYQTALELLFGGLAETDRKRQIDQLVTAEYKGQIELNGLFVCHRNDTMVGAVLIAVNPGQTATVWPPATKASLCQSIRCSVAGQLIDAAVAFARTRNVKLIQSLIESFDDATNIMLTSAGFRHVTDLVYMQHVVDASVVAPNNSAIEFVTYDPHYEDAFQSVLAKTYTDSHDVPEIAGLRTPADALIGHRSQGAFAAHRWLLARRDSDYVGIILLGGFDDINALEVTYVGVTPAARRTNVARGLIQEAFNIAYSEHRDWITLAVDSRNMPAIELYKKLGFTDWERRNVYLNILD